MVLDGLTVSGEMSELHWDIGDVVRKLRRLRGWSQTELGEAAGGIHKNTIARVEDGDEGVTSKTLKAIAAALGTTVAEMYGMIPEPGKETPRAEHATAGSTFSGVDRRQGERRKTG